MIAYGFQLIFIIVAVTGSTYLPNTRTLWIVFDMLCAIAGAAMIREIDSSHRWAKFFGYCMTMGYTPNLPIILSLFSANTGGFTKKMTINAMVGTPESRKRTWSRKKKHQANCCQIFIAYCAGNIIGPQLFFEREAPSYTSGFLSIMICYAFGLVMSLVLRVYLITENRRRDRKFGTVSEAPEAELDTHDKTDKEIEQFRYVY